MPPRTAPLQRLQHTINALDLAVLHPSIAGDLLGRCPGMSVPDAQCLVLGLWALRVPCLWGWRRPGAPAPQPLQWLHIALWHAVGAIAGAEALHRLLRELGLRRAGLPAWEDYTLVFFACVILSLAKALWLDAVLGPPGLAGIAPSPLGRPLPPDPSPRADSPRIRTVGPSFCSMSACSVTPRGSVSSHPLTPLKAPSSPYHSPARFLSRHSGASGLSLQSLGRLQFTESEVFEGDDEPLKGSSFAESQPQQSRLYLFPGVGPEPSPAESLSAGPGPERAEPPEFLEALNMSISREINVPLASGSPEDGLDQSVACAASDDVLRRESDQYTVTRTLGGCAGPDLSDAEPGPSTPLEAAPTPMPAAPPPAGGAAAEVEAPPGEAGAAGAALSGTGRLVQQPRAACDGEGAAPADTGGAFFEMSIELPLTPRGPGAAGGDPTPPSAGGAGLPGDSPVAAEPYEPPSPGEGDSAGSASLSPRSPIGYWPLTDIAIMSSGWSPRGPNSPDSSRSPNTPPTPHSPHSPHSPNSPHSPVHTPHSSPKRVTFKPDETMLEVCNSSSSRQQGPFRSNSIGSDGSDIEDSGCMSLARLRIASRRSAAPSAQRRVPPQGEPVSPAREAPSPPPPEEEARASTPEAPPPQFEVTPSSPDQIRAPSPDPPPAPAAVPRTLPPPASEDACAPAEAVALDTGGGDGAEADRSPSPGVLLSPSFGGGPLPPSSRSSLALDNQVTLSLVELIGAEATDPGPAAPAMTPPRTPSPAEPLPDFDFPPAAAAPARLGPPPTPTATPPPSRHATPPAGPVRGRAPTGSNLMPKRGGSKARARPRSANARGSPARVPGRRRPSVGKTAGPPTRTPSPAAGTHSELEPWDTRPRPPWGRSGSLLHARVAPPPLHTPCVSRQSTPASGDDDGEGGRLLLTASLLLQLEEENSRMALLEAVPGAPAPDTAPPVPPGYRPAKRAAQHQPQYRGGPPRPAPRSPMRGRGGAVPQPSRRVRPLALDNASDPRNAGPAKPPRRPSPAGPAVVRRPSPAAPKPTGKSPSTSPAKRPRARTPSPATRLPPPSLRTPPPSCTPSPAKLPRPLAPPPHPYTSLPPPSAPLSVPRKRTTDSELVQRVWSTEVAMLPGDRDRDTPSPSGSDPPPAPPPASAQQRPPDPAAPATPPPAPRLDAPVNIRLPASPLSPPAPARPHGSPRRSLRISFPPASHAPPISANKPAPPPPPKERKEREERTPEERASMRKERRASRTSSSGSCRDSKISIPGSDPDEDRFAISQILITPASPRAEGKAPVDGGPPVMQLQDARDGLHSGAGLHAENGPPTGGTGPAENGYPPAVGTPAGAGPPAGGGLPAGGDLRAAGALRAGDGVRPRDGPPSTAATRAGSYDDSQCTTDGSQSTPPASALPSVPADQPEPHVKNDARRLLHTGLLRMGTTRTDVRGEWRQHYRLSCNSGKAEQENGCSPSRL